MTVVPAQFLAPAGRAEERPAPHVADRGERAMRQLRHPFAVSAQTHPAHRDRHPA